MTAKKKATLSDLSADAKAKLLVIVMEKLLYLEKGGQLDSVLKQYGFSKDDSIAFLADLLDIEGSKKLLLLSDRQLKNLGTDRNKLTWILEQLSNRPKHEPTREAFVGFVRYMSECWTEAFSDLQKDLKKANKPQIIKQSQNLLRLEFQSKHELEPLQLNLWQLLSETDTDELNTYKEIAEAGGLQTFQEKVTDAQYKALHAVLNLATQLDYKENSEAKLIQPEKIREIGPGFTWFCFDGWDQVLKGMNVDTEAGRFTRQRAIKDFSSLENLSVPLIMKIKDPKTNREQPFIRPAGRICELIYAPYETEGGQKRTKILIGIRNEFADLSAFVQLPADLDSRIQEAVVKAGFQKKVSTDTAFIKWLYQQIANRSKHEGSVWLKNLAPCIGLAHDLKASRWQRIEDTTSRCLKIAIQGGWLLPESEIKDRKLIWKRNPELFPGGKKTPKKQPESHT